MTMARTVVRGTPYTSIKAGNAEGRAPASPKGSDGETSMEQYRGTGMSTAQGRGTPYRSEAGNGPESKRVVSADRYGKVMSNQQGDANDPMNTGPGVLLAGMGEDHSPPPAAALDSPVPGGAPVFDPGFMEIENREHLGSGNERATGGLVSVGGVMSRGMKGTSTPEGSETELTDDDTLPGVRPA
jgi:hypothetical protein